MERKCIACGMPMVKPEDFAKGETTKDYCRFCAREDGTMQNYEEKLASLSTFIVKTQGIEQSVATTTAKKMMANLPAWKEG